MRKLMLLTLILATATGLARSESLQDTQDNQSDEPPRSAEKSIPLASDIKTIEEATVDYSGQSVRTKIQYAQQGDTVFVLPVWHIRSISRNGVVLKPSDLLIDPQARGEPVIAVEVINLLANTSAEKSIHATILTRIRQLAGAAAKPSYEFSPMPFRPRTDRFTLIAPGRGQVSEIAISDELPSGLANVIVFAIRPENLKAAMTANGDQPLKMAQLFVRVQGEMKVRLEQAQVIAQVEFLRGAIAELQKSIASIKDSDGKSPEVLLQIPDGGSVKSLDHIRQLAQQSLSVTIAARSGSDTGPILSLVQSELNSLLARQKVQVSDDNQRLAFVLENQVAITATLGEIKKLASFNEKQREEAFRSAAEDYTARRIGKTTTYSGRFCFKLISGRGSSGSNRPDDKGQPAGRELETLNQAAGKLVKEFEGRIPTLSGISLDDTTITTALAASVTSFSHSKLTEAYTLHIWPPVSLAGQKETSLSSEDLLRNYAILKADYELLRNLVGTPAQLAEAKANIEKLAKLNTELQARLADTDKAIARFEKSAADTLAKVDANAVAKLQKDLKDLKRDLAGLDYSSRMESFQNLDVEIRPPGLDCTAEKGVDRATVRAAQVAWARYLGEKSHEKIMFLDKDRNAAIEMVLIPPGKYWRGSAKGVGSDDERPQTVITLDQSRWVGKYEVTQKQYKAVMGKNPSRFQKGENQSGEYPVEDVSHDECVQFARKASDATGLQFRLLTESEWEYSACAGTRTIWYNGDEEKNVGEIAEFQANNNKATARVGGKKPNNFGLYDMSGNVWEWCSDWYSDHYDTTVTTNPQGPGSGSGRVFRGGSWYDAADNCRSAERDWYSTDFRFNYLGFRISAGPSGPK